MAHFGVTANRLVPSLCTRNKNFFNILVRRPSDILNLRKIYKKLSILAFKIFGGGGVARQASYPELHPQP
jgi:hypothetical protein